MDATELEKLVESLKKQRDVFIKWRDAEKPHKDRTGWKILGFYAGRVVQIEETLKSLGSPVEPDPGNDIIDE